MASISPTQDKKDKSVRTERLFRSAVSAYCAQLRPTKRDAARLDDLTLPLLPLVSVEARRFAAAALSEAGTHPTMLIRRLADEAPEISAPLLIRSANLSDVDLIGLIGRHGLGHARAIGRRPNLNTNIARLVTALGAAIDPSSVPADKAKSTDPVSTQMPKPAAAGQATTGDAAEQVREQLRGMMRPADPERLPAPAPEPFDWRAASASYRKLLSTALTGSHPLFHTALADALDLSFGAAQTLGEDDAPGLVLALRALDLPVEQAFLIAALTYPLGFVGHENVRGFVEQFRRIELATARREITAWRERDIRRRAAHARDWEPVEMEEPANDTERNRVLRAS
ncbi:MAG: hypothetical protein JJ913_14370 [Rhizobiaceae bacterium]|nr:hypothetical protein [Rhizobiaceae bacterium]